MKCDRWFPELLGICAGLAVGFAGYTDRYFPQNDVFSYYQLFHYAYSSILLKHQIPLWEPYTSYGLPSAFDFAFTFGPSKSLAAVLGYIFGISNIKALYFAAVGLDFALIGVGSAWLARSLTGREGAHVTLAAIAMPLTHYMETLPTCGYGFALTMVFATLFSVRFLQTRKALYLAGFGLTLVANVYGNPQYLVIFEAYLFVLFLLLAGVRYRFEIRAEWKSILKSVLAPETLALILLSSALAIGLLVIDRETLRTINFTTRMRDPRTLAPDIHSYLYYLYMPPVTRIWDILTGRPIANFDVWLYFGASSFTVFVITLALGRKIRFVPELLALAFLTTAFSLPAQLPIAKFAYYYLPGMKLYRPTSYALIFAKPYAVMAIACMLSSPRMLDPDVRQWLLWAGVCVTIAVVLLTYIHPVVIFYFDSTNYPVVAIGGMFLFCFSLVACRDESWRRLAPGLLAAVLCIEIIVHRAMFEAHFYSELSKLEADKTAAHDVAVGSWYGHPRELIYQPTRIDNPNFEAPFEPLGSLYHSRWTFVGLDACMPSSRSDTYVRWIADGLKRHGASLANLEAGNFRGLFAGFDAEYGCESPKISFSSPIDRAKVVDFTANRVGIEVTASTPSLLIYRDAWTPYWKAYLDGVEIALGRNADGFKEVRIPAGSHNLKLEYEPPVNQSMLAFFALMLGSTVIVQIWLGLKEPLLASR